MLIESCDCVIVVGVLGLNCGRSAWMVVSLRSVCVSPSCATVVVAASLQKPLEIVLEFSGASQPAWLLQV